MISLRLTGQLTLAVVTAVRFCFLSLWERTEVGESFPAITALTLPSPKGRGWDRINSVGAMSQFWFQVETVRIDDCRKCQTLPACADTQTGESPSRAGGFTFD